MSVSPSDILDLARRMLVSDGSEVAARASMSRAYYSAFHCAHPIAERLPKSKKAREGVTHISHHELHSRLKEWADADEATNNLRGIVVRAFEALRLKRVQADYKLGDHCNTKDAQLQIEKSAAFARNCKALAEYMDRPESNASAA